MVVKNDEQPTTVAHTALHKAFIDSGTTAQMMKNMSLIIGKTLPSDLKIGMADKDTVKATAYGDSFLGCLMGRSRIL